MPKKSIGAAAIGLADRETTGFARESRRVHRGFWHRLEIIEGIVRYCC